VYSVQYESQYVGLNAGMPENTNIILRVGVDSPYVGNKGGCTQLTKFDVGARRSTLKGQGVA